MRRLFLLLMAPLMLSGCYTGWKLDELRRAEPQGSAYQKELAALYLIFAESEAQNADWKASQYFSTKGLHALYGNDRLPEVPEQWNVHGPDLIELQTARLSLIPLLTEENKAAKPVETAHAVFYYDCWVEEAEEVWQPADKETCRQGLVEQLEKLQPAPVEPAPVAHAAPKEAPEVASTSYLLFFEHGAIELNPEAEQTLKQVASDLQQAEPDYTVIINGHADRSGNEQLNLEIALNRAEAARIALLKMGVPEARIQTFSFGEAAPKTPTDDGNQEAQNRRVEIFIAQ